MTSSNNPSTANKLVWINAHVEDMRATDDYMSIPRAEWDAMTEQEQESVIGQFASDTCNLAGGYGAGVVDESEVPDEFKDES